MSDNAALARTGTAGAIAIGGAVITGWWILAVALAVVLVGAVLIRFAFRPGLTAGQAHIPAQRQSDDGGAGER
ncbi:hypothetical protein [Streptomyces sp. PAM3C]|uniref:hypothetical protein n=1 Tax=Streptomyces sp. PAM3C TaxID=2847300 RepID=UPI001C1E2756|nr:hypothetical protein [Streptomyces sp. PAM3C]MBU5946781.1 hypothetical protein [Streptomyces sp. PAM3C]